MQLARNFLSLILITSAVSLQASSIRSDHTEAELVAEVASIQPGEPFRMALRMKMDEHWHTYWVNPGEAGLATTLEWTELPDGFTAGPIHWPTPKRYLQEDIMNYVYEGEVFLIFTMTPPSTLEPGQTVTFKAQADWLECDPTQCVPGGGKLTLALPVQAGTPQASPWADDFEETEDNWPQDLSDHWEVSASTSADGYQLHLKPVKNAKSNPDDVYFYSRQAQVSPSAPQLFKQLDDGRFELALTADAHAAPDATHLPGVLTSANGWLADGTVKAMELNPQLTAKAATMADTEAAPSGRTLGLAPLLGLALLGGLILNLMPCVFPVLGLKIMGFVNQAGEERGKIVQHGLVFTAGVLISFWLLAGLLLVLRAGGQELGWGFQLQEPGFVLALAVVLLVFGLNMSGVFEFGNSAVGIGSQLTAKGGLSGSFFSGVLATVVATPCAAPFLAPALGGALSLPAFPSIMVFTAIAIGLSAPYLILSAFPSLVKLLPRPGAWMETFKQSMAFLLYATVAYLIWVLAGQVEAVLLRDILLGLVLISVGCWVYGRWGAPHRSTTSRWVARVLALACIAGPLAYAFNGMANEARQQTSLAEALESGEQPDFLVWQKWSPERVKTLRAEGRPVYIDFTARWCATCQVNKKAYDSQAVIDAFLRNNVALLKADWTRKDPAITRELANFGRSAVPFNVLYVPGQAEPLIMPEIFTSSTVLEKLREAGLQSP